MMIDLKQIVKILLIILIMKQNVCLELPVACHFGHFKEEQEDAQDLPRPEETKERLNISQGNNLFNQDDTQTL